MKAPDEQMVYRQMDRQMLLDDPARGVVRKTARTVVLRQDKPFIVYTEHGAMTGQPGDYLATNHPDDDPGSDVWVISADRMDATYEDSE